MNILSRLKNTTRWPWHRKKSTPEQLTPAVRPVRMDVPTSVIAPFVDVSPPSKVAATYCSRCEAWHTVQEPCLPASPPPPVKAPVWADLPEETDMSIVRSPCQCKPPKVGKLHTDPSAAVVELAERMRLRKSSR